MNQGPIILKGNVIKGKNFEPAPIIRYGIPKYADSVRDKSVISTPAWEEFWGEQLYYIMNGYQTGGVFIPGRLYYYMNYKRMSTIKGVITPDYVDLYLELANLIEYAKSVGKDIICAKGRRKGISEATSTMVIDHGWRFSLAYQGGVASGNKTYVDDFIAKWRVADTGLPPELSVKKLVDNDDEIVAGYSIKNQLGAYEEQGTKNAIFLRTMHNNPNMFKGLYLNDVIVEELGEFERFLEFRSATVDCLKNGAQKVGTMVCFGCVCAGTKVWNNKGELVNIEDLVHSDGIVGYDEVNGNISKEFISYWQPPAEKMCYRIKTNTGRVLECSEDHPILVRKRVVSKSRRRKAKDIFFVETKDLIIGDDVATIESVDIWSQKRMFEPRIIGWAVGDGSYGVSHGSWNIMIANADEDIYNYISSKYVTRVDYSAPTKDGRTLRKFRVNGVFLRDAFYDLGIVGQTKDNKRLPKDLHSYCKKDVCEFLGGYFDADGCIYLNERTKEVFLKLTSANFEILNEVRFILQKIGIRCNIMYEKMGKSPKSTRGHYNLIIKDQKSILCFHENIKFFIKKKQDKFNKAVKAIKNQTALKKSGQFKGLRFETIKSVECIGMKPIYNLTAANTHTYVANGIVTHNTGGNVNKGSKDFKKAWAEADSLGMIKFLIPATRSYYYGGARDVEKQLPTNSELFKKYKPFQLIGVEDFQIAEKNILDNRQALSKSGNIKAYNEDLQNNPLNESEIFKKTVVNNFNVEKLNAQDFALITAQYPKYSKYKMEWVKDSNGMIKMPLQVNLLALKEHEDQNECIWIIDSERPRKNHTNLYTIGCLLPGEKVLTEKGLMSVEKVDLDNKLINKDGKLVGINELQSYLVKDEDVYEIKTSNTFRTTKFTSEHPIYSSSGVLKQFYKKHSQEYEFNQSFWQFDGFKFNPVENLKIGEWIKVPNIYRQENEFDISELWNYNVRKDFMIDCPVNDPDFWWLIGLWLGDGYCLDKTSRISICINKNEVLYIDRLCSLIHRLFNRTPTQRIRKGVNEVSFVSRQLALFLKDNFGKYSTGKFIPEWAKRISYDLKKELITGYLDSDGNIKLEKNRQLYCFGFVSINLELLESFQDILFSIGFVSNICLLRGEKEHCFGNRKSKTKTCYQLRLGHNDTVNLVRVLKKNDKSHKLNRVDFNNIKKTRRRPNDGCFIDKSGEYIYFQVTEIKKSKYTGVVHNFDCDTHTFMCHHITTHNCDSYDQDTAKTSKSLGALCVMIRMNTIPNAMKKAPVAVISCRPRRKEKFYEMCLMTAVLYNAIGNVLVDVGAGLVMEYFREHGGWKYLADRPRKFESENSDQTHEKGVRLTNFSRPRMAALMGSHIEDYVQDIHFPELINQLGNYDEVEVGSDNDLADAYGLALMQDQSCDVRPRDQTVSEEDDMYDLPEFHYNADGELMMRESGPGLIEDQQDHDNFGQ